MKSFLQKTSGAVLFALLVLGSSSLKAQNKIAGAVQQGNGAYVQKYDRPLCVGNSFLGIPNLPTNCLDMTQEKFLVTPSGNAMTVWVGTVPAASRPTQRLVFNSTWTETNNDGVTCKYDNVAVTEPNGTVRLTMTDKNNQPSKKARGKK